MTDWLLVGLFGFAIGAAVRELGEFVGGKLRTRSESLDVPITVDLPEPSARERYFMALGRRLLEFDDSFETAKHDGYFVAINRRFGGNYGVQVALDIADFEAQGYGTDCRPDVAFVVARELTLAHAELADQPAPYTPTSEPCPSTLPTGGKP